MPLLLRLVALLLLEPSAAWITISQSTHGATIERIRIQTSPDNGTNPNRGSHVANTLNFIWSSPAGAYDESGLGGGLTWAFDPKICTDGELLGSFRESIFGAGLVTCHSLQTAMHRAFDSWAANSPRISFQDVTSTCETWHAEVNGGVGTMEKCPYAEIWVTYMLTSKAAPSTSNRDAVDVVTGRRQLQSSGVDFVVDMEVGEGSIGNGTSSALSASTTAALANNYPGYMNDFRFSNGNVNGQTLFGNRRATVSFNPSLCWYLDSTFCSGFHVAKDFLGTDNAQILITAGAFTIFGLACLFMLFRCGGCFSEMRQAKLLGERQNEMEREAADTNGDGQIDFQEFCALERKLHVNKRFSEEQLKMRFGKLDNDASGSLDIKEYFAARKPPSACDALMGAVRKQNMCVWAFVWTFLVFPVAFYTQVFSPCWECFDFEAAATHEIGHVLGLTHPDNDLTKTLCKGASYCPSEPGVNSYNALLQKGGAFNASSCNAPWSEVAPFTAEGYAAAFLQNAEKGPKGDYFEILPDGKAKTLIDKDGYRPSIMKALTQHNPRVCLSDDDLEALNTLYPDCDRMVTEPVCYKSNYNIGWVRLGIWTLCPVLLIMIMQLIVAANLQNYQTKLYEEMKTAAAVLNETLTEKEKEVEKKNRQMTRLKKQSVHEKAKAVQDEREKNTAKNVARKLGAWQKKSTAEPFHSVSATSAAVTSVDAV